ncbi:MAG: hypothetical protein HGA95_04760 [Caldiserica bacterium]|nr:hypothetical protein [Caldisericota bacterium]
MFVTDYVDNIFCFDAKGYKYKKLNTDGFWWPWYLYEGSNSFGLLAIKRAGYLSPRIVDDFGFLDYIAFSGLPKDIQYVMTASDEYGKYWIYAYTMKDIYMIPSRSSDDTTFSIKTINVSLPTNQNLLIDWVPYWVGIAIIILAVLAKGFLNVVERLF